MTIEEVREHLKTNPLYVVERHKSRTGVPSIASFYVVYNNSIERIDNVICFLLRGSKLVPVGEVQAVYIHDPYIHTLESHMRVISDALFGKEDALRYRVI